MDHFVALTFALAVVGTSIALVVWHLNAWRALRDVLPQGDERVYRSRQFRRRMQASTMIGLVGVAIYLGYLIPHRTSPRLFVGFWTVVIFLVLWIAALAGADYLSTRAFFGRRRRVVDAERAGLEYQLREAERSKRNGQH